MNSVHPYAISTNYNYILRPQHTYFNAISINPTIYHSDSNQSM